MATQTGEYTFDETKRVVLKRQKIRKDTKHRKAIDTLVASGLLVVQTNGKYMHRLQVFVEELSCLRARDQTQMDLLVKTLTRLIEAHPYTYQFLMPGFKQKTLPELLCLVGPLGESSELKKLLKKYRGGGLAKTERDTVSNSLRAGIVKILFKNIPSIAVDPSTSTKAAALLEELSLIVEAAEAKTCAKRCAKDRAKRNAPERERRDKVKLRLEEAILKTTESLDTNGYIASMLSDSSIRPAEVAKAIKRRFGKQDLPKLGDGQTYLIVAGRVSKGTELRNDGHGQDMRLQWSQDCDKKKYGENCPVLIARLSGICTRREALSSPM